MADEGPEVVFWLLLVSSYPIAFRRATASENGYDESTRSLSWRQQDVMKLDFKSDAAAWTDLSLSLELTI